MIWSRLHGLLLQPANYLITQTRGVRPILKIGKDKFQLSLDVHQFKQNEIVVKARPEYVIVEGKQERKLKQGYVIRHMVRKFKLPSGCSIKGMESKLSSEGILTITASRKTCDINNPCETQVPITFTGPTKDENESLIKKTSECPPCDKFTNLQKGNTKK